MTTNQHPPHRRGPAAGWGHRRTQYPPLSGQSAIAL